MLISTVEKPIIQQFRQPVSARHRYQAYGLAVGADTALPELFGSSGSSGCDVDIKEGSVDLPMCEGDRVAYRPVSAETVIVQWPTVGALTVRNGRSITYERAPGVCPVIFRMFLICQGLGVILLQRKRLVLHASCVEFEGQAIAFAGPCGAGKSTVAAACCQLGGGRLLADDVLAISIGNEGIAMAHPGFPRIKLRPDAAVRFSPDPEMEAMAVGEFGKSLHDLGTRFANGAIPLRRIYILADAMKLAIESLAMRDAFPALMQHTYGRALIPHLKLEGTHLQQCGALVRSRAVRLLGRPRDLDLMPAVVNSVRADLD